MFVYPGDPSNRTDSDHTSPVPWLLLLIALVVLILAVQMRLI